MNQYNVAEVASLVVWIELLESQCHCNATLDGIHLNFTKQDRTAESVNAIRERAKTIYQKAIPILESANLSDSIKQMALAKNHLVDGHSGIRDSLPALQAECKRIKDTIIWELAGRAFLLVDTARTNHIDNGMLLGEVVSRVFEHAVPEIKEAGNCLAADCNTAAVFHLMRVVEFGIRALCDDLGFRQMRNKITNKLTGTIRFEYQPVSHATWEKILSQIPARVEKRLRRFKPGSKKQELQEFYNEALEEIRSIKDAWRNHVMHTRTSYSAKDVDAIKDHVSRLMIRLATRLGEV